jgi:hypothetical protein
MKSTGSSSNPRARMSLIHIAVRGALLAGAALPFAPARAAGPPPAQPLLVASGADQQQVDTGATGDSGTTSNSKARASRNRKP